MHRARTYYVYLMTNRSKTLYVGITNDLVRRVWEHKNHLNPGFTDRYLIDRLVWYELHFDVRTAIAREKQLKGWKRARKMALVVAMNPTWKDLAAAWYQPLARPARQDA